MPELPQPVPISTTARAPMAAVEEPQRGPDGGRNRRRPAEVGGVGSSGQQRFVLNHLSRLVVVDDWPPSRSFPNR